MKKNFDVNACGVRVTFYPVSSALVMASSEAKIRVDLNNPVFQDNLFTLQKPERHAALETLDKIRQLTWNQLYRDQGLKWEKVTSTYL